MRLALVSKKSKVLYFLPFLKFKNVVLCFYGFFTHFTTFYSFSGVPFPPSNKLTMAEVFDPRTNKPRTEVKNN